MFEAWVGTDSKSIEVEIHPFNILLYAHGMNLPDLATTCAISSRNTGTLQHQTYCPERDHSETIGSAWRLLDRVLAHPLTHSRTPARSTSGESGNRRSLPTELSASAPFRVASESPSVNG
jgi:hypothetical protein